jgi:predicted cobalt transporter CbtA
MLTKNRKIIIPLLYGLIMIGAYMGLPQNPDAITIPSDLVTGFRISSVLTMAAYWGMMSVVFGFLWNKLKPHEEEGEESTRTLNPI